MRRLRRGQGRASSGSAGREWSEGSLEMSARTLTCRFRGCLTAIPNWFVSRSASFPRTRDTALRSRAPPPTGARHGLSASVFPALLPLARSTRH
jgi:hypothetical protein